MKAKAAITVRSKIVERIRRTRKTDVFLREDFSSFAGYDVVGRELRKLVGEGLIVQVGYGLYARAKPSVLSGKPIPVRPLENIGYQALERLGYSPKAPAEVQAYNERRSTQIPTGDRISVPGARIKRKISFGPRVIQYT